tara:strand:+ start:2434 stop:2646 length:213 start_codon:yes stop_codon:yes gene_type:complete
MRKWKFSPGDMLKHKISGSKIIIIERGLEQMAPDPEGLNPPRRRYYHTSTDFDNYLNIPKETVEIAFKLC